MSRRVEMFARDRAAWWRCMLVPSVILLAFTVLRLAFGWTGLIGWLFFGRTQGPVVVNLALVAMATICLLLSWTFMRRWGALADEIKSADDLDAAYDAFFDEIEKGRRGSINIRFTDGSGK